MAIMEDVNSPLLNGDTTGVFDAPELDSIVATGAEDYPGEPVDSLVGVVAVEPVTEQPAEDAEVLKPNVNWKRRWVPAPNQPVRDGVGGSIWYIGYIEILAAEVVEYYLDEK